MRDFQRLLLIVGAAALGAGLSGLGVISVFAGRPTPPGFGGLGAAGLALISLAIGALLGGIAGFVAAILWVRRRRGETWGVAVWCGIAIGVLVGSALHALGRIAESDPPGGGPESWPVVLIRSLVEKLPFGGDLAAPLAFRPIALVLIPALGMAGGMAATSLTAIRKRRAGRRLRNDAPPGSEA